MKDRIESATRKMVEVRGGSYNAPAFVAVRPRPGVSFLCAVHGDNFEGPGIKFDLHVMIKMRIQFGTASSGGPVGSVFEITICPACLTEMAEKLSGMILGRD